MYSVVFIVSRTCIGINLSTYNLKNPSTPLNGSSSLVISGIITSFSFRYIDQNGSSVKTLLNFNYQNHSLITISILKVQKLMSTFENKS